MKEIKEIKKEIENIFQEITSADKYALINSQEVNNLNYDIFKLTKDCTTISDFELIKDELNELIDSLDFYTDYQYYDGNLDEPIKNIENIINSIEDEDTKKVVKLAYTPYIDSANIFNDALKKSYDEYNKYAVKMKESLNLLFSRYTNPETFNYNYVEEDFRKSNEIEILDDINNIYLDEYKYIIEIANDLFNNDEQE